MGARYKSRVGKHGTQYRFRIDYQPGDGCRPFAWFCWAYDAADAMDKFHADPGEWRAVGSPRKQVAA